MWMGDGIYLMGMRVIACECDGPTTRPALQQGRYVEYKAPCVAAKAFDNTLSLGLGRALAVAGRVLAEVPPVKQGVMLPAREVARHLELPERLEPIQCDPASLSELQGNVQLLLGVVHALLAPLSWSLRGSKGITLRCSKGITQRTQIGGCRERSCAGCAPTSCGADRGGCATALDAETA